MFYSLINPEENDIRNLAIAFQNISLLNDDLEDKQIALSQIARAILIINKKYLPIEIDKAALHIPDIRELFQDAADSLTRKEKDAHNLRLLESASRALFTVLNNIIKNINRTYPAVYEPSTFGFPIFSQEIISKVFGDTIRFSFKKNWKLSIESPGTVDKSLTVSIFLASVGLSYYAISAGFVIITSSVATGGIIATIGLVSSAMYLLLNFPLKRCLSRMVGLFNSKHQEWGLNHLQQARDNYSKKIISTANKTIADYNQILVAEAISENRLQRREVEAKAKTDRSGATIAPAFGLLKWMSRPIDRHNIEHSMPIENNDSDDGSSFNLLNV